MKARGRRIARLLFFADCPTREWIPDDDAEPGGDLFDQRPYSGKWVEIRREDGSILALDSD